MLSPASSTSSHASSAGSGTVASSSSSPQPISAATTQSTATQRNSFLIVLLLYKSQRGSQLGPQQPFGERGRHRTFVIDHHTAIVDERCQIDPVKHRRIHAQLDLQRDLLGAVAIDPTG